MKVAKIVGLLLTAVLFNHVQSMELPTQHPLEEKLFDGTISVESYLLTLERTPQYRAMLTDLRTARYAGDINNNLYLRLINTIRRELQRAQMSFQNLIEEQIAAEELGDIKRQIPELLYGRVRDGIHTLYNYLQRLLTIDRVHLGKNT